MAGLPLGWEWDYDGQRWFYKYKPTGHIQYHFPSEGDEFPDYIEAGTPAPDLAPEERLESQQQVKRQISSTGADHGGVNKYAMSATARPISAIWEGDHDAEDDGVFQPENFMFLGPGTYVDVSPLVEEEEEAAKRSVVGAVGERVEGGRSTETTTGVAMAQGVSPPGSSNTTPMMAKSEPSASSKPVDARIKEEGPAIESVPVTNTAHIVESKPVPSQPPAQIESAAAVTEASGSTAIHMIDSREMPVEMMGDTMHRFDPVGFVAEMPTEQTAAAHIELHPDPVEIADNTVLAPIEMAATAFLESAIAELPAKNSPVEGKGFPIVTSPKGPEGRQSTDGDKMMREDDTHPTEQAPQDHVQLYGQDATKGAESTPLAQNTDPSCANQDPRQGLGQYDPHLVQHGQNQLSRPVKPETFKIGRKQPGSMPGTPVAQQTQSPSYQAYVPGQTTTTSHLANPEKRHSIGLRREVTLMMNMKRSSIGVDPNAVPRVLSPPQHAVPNAISQSPMPAQPRSTEFTKPTADGMRTDNIELYLAHAPSVLKPARNRNSVQDIPPRQRVSTPAAVIAPPAQPQPESQRSEGISKFPSVLRPARGSSSSQPGQGANGPVHQLDGPRVVQQTNRQSLAQPPLWATAHIVQPARPASAMPIMNHAPYGSQYAGAGPGPISQRHQLAQPSSSGCQLLESRCQPSPLQQMHKAVTSRLSRPQTVVGTVQAVPEDTTKATTPIRPQQPASESFVQPHLQIENVATEQFGRSRSVPAVIQPQLNAPTLQQESVNTQCQVQLAQQVRHVEAGQPQPQPHSHQPHRPSASHFQLTPTQLVQNPAGEQSNVPQNVQPAVNAGAAIETQSLTTQLESPKTISPSLFQVQPLLQIQNAAAGQPSQLRNTPAPPRIGQGRMGTTTQRTSHANQAPMGHLKACSTPAPLLNQPAVNNKWAQRPVADYSGGDWGDEENWERR